MISFHIYKGIEFKFETTLNRDNNEYHTIFHACFRQKFNRIINNHKLHEHPKGKKDTHIEYKTPEESEASAIIYAKSIIDEALDCY